MGNSQSAAGASPPLALARRRNCHAEGPSHRNTNSVAIYTFGTTSRTAPITEDGTASDKGKTVQAARTTVYWPADLEEEYIFEEAYDFGSANLARPQFSRDHLRADLELQTGIVSTITGAESNRRPATRRVGRRRGQGLSVVPLETPEAVQLDLSDRGLVRLTRNIGLYARLVSLDLSKNELTELPAEICLLSRLEELNLSENRLTLLPETIGQLKGLCELNLKYNHLTTLPSGIGGLQRLKVLVISHNKFRTIPRDVGRLARLATFEAERNQIEYLPAEMSLLNNLRTIQLYGNPLIAEASTAAKEAAVTRGGPLSLLETAARSIIRGDVPVLSSMPDSLTAYLLSAQECIFCHGPYMDNRCGKIRHLQRGDQAIPFMYYLCAPHWTNEEDRIRAMFQRAPATAPEGVLLQRRQIHRTAFRGLAVHGTGSSRARRGFKRLGQLRDKSLPMARPGYRPLGNPRGTTGSGGSGAGTAPVAYMDIEQLSQTMSRASIAVEHGWMAVPTVLERQ